MNYKPHLCVCLWSRLFHHCKKLNECNLGNVTVFCCQSTLQREILMTASCCRTEDLKIEQLSHSIIGPVISVGFSAFRVFFTKHAQFSSLFYFRVLILSEQSQCRAVFHLGWLSAKRNDSLESRVSNGQTSAAQHLQIGFEPEPDLNYSNLLQKPLFFSSITDPFWLMSLSCIREE